MLQIRDLRFRYSGCDTVSFHLDSLDIERGEMVLVCGPTGSGKTTFFRCINSLIPHFYGGEFGGHVVVEGLDTRDAGPYEMSGLIGTVFQDPESQFIMLSAREEIAFNLRNHGMGEEEIEQAIERVSSLLGDYDLVEKNVVELSAGQKQRIAIASVAAWRPPYILLDEPTSQLDDNGTASLMDLLLKLNARGHTIIMSEHRIERVAEFFNRFILINEGTVAVDGNYQDIEKWYGSKGVSLRYVNVTDDRPITAATWDTRVGLSVTGLSVSLGGKEILHDVSVRSGRGEIVMIAGRNGSGKTTLLRAIMNFIPKNSGRVMADGVDISEMEPFRIAQYAGYLSHNPLSYLFHQTLDEELRFSERYLSRDRHAESALNGDGNYDGRYISGLLGLEGMIQRFPREFSCGERELAAIACTLVGGRKILLLDEPTRGMDYWKKSKFMSVIRKISRDSGISVLMTTHDKFLLASFADRIYRMEDGRIAESEFSECAA